MRADHPAVPITPDELARDAAVAVSAGADAIHVHPRDAGGRETLDPEAVGAVVNALTQACPDTLVGVTTGLWTVGSAAERLDLIARWHALPDFASVNVGEEGAEELCSLLLDRGVDVEAGVWSLDEADRLLASRPDVYLRVLVEPADEDPGAAVATANAIVERLRAGGLRCPLVEHGQGIATWTVVRHALARGNGVRVGLEDTLVLEDGRPARGNEELVAAARAIAGG